MRKDGQNMEIQYKKLSPNQFYIDKTDLLEKRLEEFPAVYLEGTTASGKTTAVKILLEHHPEVHSTVINMKSVRNMAPLTQLQKCSELFECTFHETDGKQKWLIFENLDGNESAELYEYVTEMITNMQDSVRVIFVSREKPVKQLLKLLWKRKMDLISQAELRFTLSETAEIIEAAGSKLKAMELFELTSGWAGCVDMLVRMSIIEKSTENIRRLCDSYEIRTYIQTEILDSLSAEERTVLAFSCLCPWTNVELCETILKLSNTEGLLNSLERKGILIHDEAKMSWRSLGIFRNQMHAVVVPKVSDELWFQLGIWYEKNGYIQPALDCLSNMHDDKQYQECLIRNYTQVPFLGIDYDEVTEWQENTPEVCYLRGMYFYLKRDQKGLNREIEKIEKQKQANTREILLNLWYVNPDVTLEKWMQMLEAEHAAGKVKSFHLYHMLGSSCSFLCGLRDLSGLFSNTKREENYNAKVWKTCLGQQEWQGYQLARLEYYLETERKNAILQEDKLLLLTDEKDSYNLYSKQLDMARIYLLGELIRVQPFPEYIARFEEIRTKISRNGIRTDVRKAEALANLYSVINGQTEYLIRWLRQIENSTTENHVTADLYIRLWCMVRGYFLLKQYEKAERILRWLIPYMQFYQRTRDLAEAWYLQAMLNNLQDRKGQALQNMIESFLISSNFRYVNLYSRYGTFGQDVIALYIDWHMATWPENWHSKKKYQYGNVLRMPMEDYLGVVKRCVRKESRLSNSLLKENRGDRLTMMELLILQCINKGLSNTEICKELNLKLPTVKTHIYNMFKKLDVDSRVQAIIKGKELGVLE